jgi:hypothetical protein
MLIEIGDEPLGVTGVGARREFFQQAPEWEVVPMQDGCDLPFPTDRFLSCALDHSSLLSLVPY